MDGTPLPIAESALYVDPMPSFAPKCYPDGKHENQPAEKDILDNLLEMVKIFYLLQKEPLVDWSNDSKNRPIAEVLLTWDHMPGLTLNGQTTKLTYLFNTYDYDLAPKNMRHFLVGVDILWATDDQGKNSCPHIDLTMIVIAAVKSDLWFHQYFDSLEQAKNSKFYNIGNMYTFKSSNYYNESQNSAMETGVAMEIASTDIGQNGNKRPCPNRFNGGLLI